MKTRFFLLLSILAVLAPFSWSQEQPIEINKVAALVNGDVILESEIQFMMASIVQALAREKSGQALQEAVEEARQQTLQDLIDRELILDEFDKLGAIIKEHRVKEDINRRILENFDGSREKFLDYLSKGGMSHPKYKELVRKQLAVQGMRGRALGSPQPATPDELRRVYEENKAQFAGEDFVQISKIYLRKLSDSRTAEQTQTLAEEIRRKLRAGADFAQMAKMHSEDGFAVDGGSMPVMARTDLSPSLGDPAFSLKVGAISEVIEDSSGFTILKVDARDWGARPSLPEVRDQVENLVVQEHRQEAYDQWINQLRRKAVVRTF
ncbi:MAG: peptidylprolyl isomerase [Verrucomicrobiota bacterium]